MELIGSGTVNVRSMITHGVPLSAIQTGFRLVSEARESLKVVVVPDKSFYS
jgi:threonine dehydrogenase-like Zn-dependent dehydrogenase